MKGQRAVRAVGVEQDICRYFATDAPVVKIYRDFIKGQRAVRALAATLAEDARELVDVHTYHLHTYHVHTCHIHTVRESRKLVDIYNIYICT